MNIEELLQTQPGQLFDISNCFSLKSIYQKEPFLMEAVDLYVQRGYVFGMVPRWIPLGRKITNLREWDGLVDEWGATAKFKLEHLSFTQALQHRLVWTTWAQMQYVKKVGS